MICFAIVAIKNHPKNISNLFISMAYPCVHYITLDSSLKAGIIEVIQVNIMETNRIVYLTAH